MLVLGLTGSIAMGKSTAAAALRRLGVPVHDADATVHALMAPGGKAYPLIAEAFPDSLVDGIVDRRRLGAAVFGDPPALARLEGILHPLVRRDSDAFVRQHRRARRRLVCLDIPLLYETGGDCRCDAVVVVSAPAAIQRQRILRRPGMTVERMEAILAAQVPDREKRRLADFVVPSSLGKHESLRRLAAIVRLLRSPEAPLRRYREPCCRRRRPESEHA